MLHVGDKIQLVKEGKVFAYEEVKRIDGNIATTNTGKQFPVNAKILFPRKGHRYGFRYEPVQQ